ncbi:MAG: DUF1109 domain-containing protein [bacterium]|nr:DUF1109 domain-containing protein [bacterium]
MPHDPVRTNPPEHLEFVDALVADLRVVEPAPSLRTATAEWVGLGVLATSLALLALGAFRDGALADLQTPRVALEFLFGVATLVALARAGLEAGVPGSPPLLRLVAPAVALGVVWLGVALGPIPLHGPDPSMVGKRAHCFLEGLAITLLPAAWGLRAIRRRSLGAGALGGALIGLAAGALPAVAMQLACMYDPEHALHFHFTPMLVGGGIAALLGAWLEFRD